MTLVQGSKRAKPKPSNTKITLIHKHVFATFCSLLHTIITSWEECSWSEVTGLRWNHWLEVCRRWHWQQYRHFDTACRRPKGQQYFSFVIMMSTSEGCAPRYLRHPPAMSNNKQPFTPRLYACFTVPVVPKMFFGAISFTTSSCHGCCRVVLVPPPPPFFLRKVMGITSKKSDLCLFPHSSCAFLSCLHPMLFTNSMLGAFQKLFRRIWHGCQLFPKEPKSQ